jgi:hypothetical protein
MPKLDRETTQPSLLKQGERAYCEHCPMWGQCSVCGSDHPRYLLLKTKPEVARNAAAPTRVIGKGVMTVTNQTDPWCVYLTSQMQEKFGFSRDVAHHMVCTWLKSIRNVRTGQGREVENPKRSSRGRVQSKMASARA